MACGLCDKQYGARGPFMHYGLECDEIGTGKCMPMGKQTGMGKQQRLHTSWQQYTPIGQGMGHAIG